MGVYYYCPSCNNTLHLTPQSRGFGQMKVACFVCGREARYSPSGPAPDANVVNAPETGRPASSATPAIPHGMHAAAADMPNPTVPMQTPDALLALDAHETAATIPVQGLSDADIARMLNYGSHHAEPESDATMRSDAPEFLANVPLGGYGGGHSATPQHRPAPDPWQQVSASTSSDKTRRPTAPRTPKEDVEEEIPTRSVAGLADRDISAYASGFYQGLDTNVPEPAPAAPAAQPWSDQDLRVGPAATAPAHDDRHIAPVPTPVRHPQPAPRQAPQPAPAPQPSPAPQARAAQRPATPPDARHEPELSNSMFNQLGVGDGPRFGDSGPQPKTGLGADRFTGEYPAARRPGSGGGTVWIIAAVVMLVLAVGVIVGGLYVYKSRRAAPASPEKVVAPEGGGEGAGEGANK